MDRHMMIFLSGVTWNIFLALIPIILAYTIDKIYKIHSTSIIRNTSIALIGLVWIFFLPNTCYLLTTWRHFLADVGSNNLHTRWQDNSVSALYMMIYTLFYLCYSGIGVYAFALATRPIVRIIENTRTRLWIFGIPFFILMSVGVYLGLILRFNSWDILSRPQEIWWSAAQIIDKPVLAGLIILFAGFLWITYMIMDIWLDGFMCRWKKTCMKY